MKKVQQIILAILFLSSCNENNNLPADLSQADQTTTGVYDTTENKQALEQVRELCMKLQDQALEHNIKGNIQQSIAADSQALVLAEKAELRSEMITIIKRLERKYAVQLKRTQSHQLIKKGQEIARQLNDKRAEIDFHAATAMWYFYGREFEKALPISEECLKMSKEINYSFGISNALFDIGSIYMNMGQLEKGTKYYFANRVYADSLKGTVYEAFIYQSVSSAFVTFNQYDSAMYYSLKATHIADSLQDKKAYAGCLVSLAGLYFKKGDFEQAESLAHKVLQLSREINFKAQISTILNMLKDVSVIKGNYKQALSYYEQFVAIRDEINNDETLLKAQEKEYTYNLENKKRENLLLVQQNQIQQFQINKNHYLLSAFIFLLAAVLIIGYLLFHQSKIKTENLKMTTEQKLLRAQMNPHFIFNSLNSIKYFINVDQKEQADTYLTTFSKLVRNMMESSIEDSHNLKEESEMLNNYLEIESLRFNSVFTYEITIDEKLKHIVPRIPQLMIQPFVENAIWHGLLSKNGDKTLTVSFYYNSPDKISCIIDDNGIGRKASESKRNSAKKQRAIEFAKQRINLMRKSHKIDCKLVITDKYDDENNPTGTTVFIELPILRNNPK